MTVDRAALIEAATEAAQRIVASPQFNTNAVQRTVDAVLVATVMPAALDAILPLIADAIEAEGRQVVQSFEPAAAGRPGSVEMGRLIGAEDAYKHAIRLVRSLGGNETKPERSS